MIKFNQFNVQSTVTGEKAKVWYSLDNRFDGRNCVTIYSKDYNRALGRIFADVGGYKNDTDTQTDYFDKGRSRSTKILRCTPSPARVPI
jgi:hypothetical protein